MRTIVLTFMLAAALFAIAAQLVSKADEVSGNRHYVYVKAALVATHTADNPMFEVNSGAKQNRNRS